MQPQVTISYIYLEQEVQNYFMIIGYSHICDITHSRACEVARVSILQVAMIATFLNNTDTLVHTSIGLLEAGGPKST